MSAEEVAGLLASHWPGFVLGRVLKVSQNTTFSATGADGRALVVRATPRSSPVAAPASAVAVELQFLLFARARGLSVCAPVAASDGALRVEGPTTALSVFEFAPFGTPVDYSSYVWMTDDAHVSALGRWLARLHALSREFARERPDLAAAARRWDDLHGGILRGVDSLLADADAADDPARFGLIHGDVNPSNYYFDDAAGMLWVFDWDQLQRAWFLYDVAQPIWGVALLSGAGSPVDRKPVPEADVDRFTHILVDAYERESNGPRVDRAELQRMVLLRRELYARFCARAVVELPSGHPIRDFCEFVNAWLVARN